MSPVTETSTAALGKQGEMLFGAKLMTLCFPSKVFRARKHNSPVRLVNTSVFSGYFLRLGVNSFHEKADPCQEFFCSLHDFFSLFPVQPSRLCRHPSIRTLW
jgi:hypothetical protein